MVRFALGTRMERKTRYVKREFSSWKSVTSPLHSRRTCEYEKLIKFAIIRVSPSLSSQAFRDDLSNFCVTKKISQSSQYSVAQLTLFRACIALLV